MSLRQYLPSKQFAQRFGAILLVAAILIGVMELFGYLKRKKQEEGKIAPDSFVEVSVSDVIEVDSDQDGVRDWEEILYGTDPSLAETTPGTPDKAFVDGRRDEAAKAQALSGGEDQNATARFAQEFLSSIIALQQAGLVTPENSEKLTDSFFEYIKEYPMATVYTEKSFTVLTTTTAAQLKTYLTLMNSVLTKNPIKNDTAVITLGLVLKDGNTERLSKLGSMAKGYESAVTSLSKAVVPVEALSAHLKIINAYDQLGKGIRGMMKFEEDPLPGFVAITRYQEHIDMASNGFLEFQTFISMALEN